MSSNDSAEPSLLASHAKYAAGAAKETIGNVTGSEEWKKSGVEEKESAVKEMRAANTGEGIGGARVGKVEESLGGAVGCEGMIEEGKNKQSTQ